MPVVSIALFFLFVSSVASLGVRVEVGLREVGQVFSFDVGGCWRALGAWQHLSQTEAYFFEGTLDFFVQVV